MCMVRLVCTQWHHTESTEVCLPRIPLNLQNFQSPRQMFDPTQSFWMPSGTSLRLPAYPTETLNKVYLDRRAKWTIPQVQGDYHPREDPKTRFTIIHVHSQKNLGTDADTQPANLTGYTYRGSHHNLTYSAIHLPGSHHNLTYSAMPQGSVMTVWLTSAGMRMILTRQKTVLQLPLRLLPWKQLPQPHPLPWSRILRRFQATACRTSPF